MIGLLFHGPEVFDRGLAQQVISAVKKVAPVRLMLAGTMGRTALHDANLKDEVECPGVFPGKCIPLLTKNCAAVVIVNYAKTEQSGMRFGGMIANKLQTTLPLLQVEGEGNLLIQWIKGAPAALLNCLRHLPLTLVNGVAPPKNYWEEGGRGYRVIHTARKGDYILVDGIMVGRAKKDEVVLVAEGRELVAVQGAQVKEHGLEKLRRFGGIDLERVKLATTNTLRDQEVMPRVVAQKGTGVAFIDHAGMYIYTLARDVAGAVTVGDDTTAIVADILYRFGIPSIGIVDGDSDAIHTSGKITPGSIIILVATDDIMGLEIKEKVFQGQDRSPRSFAQIKEAVLKLIGNRYLSITEIPPES